MKVIAMTAGDPCGIGPEVILKTLQRAAIPSRARVAVIGDLAVFERIAARLRRRLPAWEVRRPPDGLPASARPLIFLDCGSRRVLELGRSSRAAGERSLAYLDQAMALWRTRRIQALVTAPVTKWAIARVEPTFRGQTEYLAQAMGARDIVMMFVSDALRVALLTRHIPLSHVARTLSARQLRTTLRLTAGALTQWFGCRAPRLALCGLNPHAGEDGRCGREEQTLMQPALRAARRAGLRCDGPFAADGFFAEGASCYDAVVCPYHDQGLIPFKLLARDRGCQFSVGLPIVRTSPDHGSALDIAGRGIAHPGSMRYALELAIRLARFP